MKTAFEALFVPESPKPQPRPRPIGSHRVPCSARRFPAPLCFGGDPSHAALCITTQCTSQLTWGCKPRESLGGGGGGSPQLCPQMLRFLSSSSCIWL